LTGNNHLIFDEGDVYLMDVTFYNTSGALTTPSSTTFAQRKPSQTETGGTAVTTGWTTVSTGRLTRPITLDEPGLWRLEARGAGNSVDQRYTFAIEVRRSAVRV